MIATTLRAIARDFVSTIESLTPDYEEHRDIRFRFVDQLSDVPSERLRLFYTRWGFPEPEEDGIYGSGIEYGVDLDVFVNYRGLPETAPGGTQFPLAEIVSADGRQLWVALQERADPVVSGLVTVLYRGFAPEEDEPQQVWGAHQLRVRFLLEHD